MLRLRTLGGLSLCTDDGADHPLLSQPKRLGLLIYLAAANGAGFRRRDQVMSLFWPELDGDHARGALRQATYVLRRDLGESVVRSRGEEEIGVDPDALWFDVTAFLTALAAGDARAAFDLYQGDFLEAFFVTGAAPEFEQWLESERQRLRAMGSRAMWLVADQTAAGDPAAAIEAIRRAVALAPDDEIALRRALGQLATLGDRARALQLYQAFCERLLREYGAQPSTETKAIGQALQRSGDPTPSEGRVDAPSLAGRSDAVDIAATRNNSTTSNRGSAVAAASVPRRSWPARFALATAAMASIALVVSAARNFDVRSLTESGQVAASDELLVADVQAPEGDSLNARAITELLRSSLAATRSIRVVTREAQDQTLRRMLLPINTRLSDTVAREIAVRSGYEAVLLTDLRPIGRGFVLTSRVTTVPGGELASITETAPSGDALIAAVDRLARALRRRLGESRDSLADILPLQQVTTRSLKALALFTHAQEESRIHGQQPPHVLALLRETIAADSTFAMAHRRLGAAYFNLGLTRESLAAFRAAERFSDRSTDEESRLVIRMMLHGNQRDYERAIAEAHEVLRLNPRNPMALNQLPAYRFSLGQFDRVDEEMGRLGVVKPNPVNSWTYQGHGAKALDFARQRLREAHDSTWVNSTRSARNLMARLHAATFAYDSAMHYAIPLSGSDPGTPLILAASRMAKGQLALAMTVQASRVRSGDWEIYMTDVRTGVESFSAMAEMLLVADTSSARQRLQRVITNARYRDVDPANRPIRPVLALALAGRSSDARRVLVDMERAVEHDDSGDIRRARALDFEYARGAVAISEGRAADAIAAFTAASTSMMYVALDTCRVCALPWLGRAYELAHQPDSVVAVYERYLTTGDPFRLSSDALWRARILQRLGQLHAQRGDTAMAIKRLAEFIELWKDADPSLQREVERAARQLAALRASAPIAVTPRVAAR